MQERPLTVEVGRIRLVGDIVHDRPSEGDTDEARETIPLKPLTGLAVTVATASVPAFTADTGLVAIVKSTTLNVTLAV